MGRDDFLTELARIIPPERLLTKPAQLVPFESDALTAFRKRPLAVGMVESEEEVIETVRLCARHEVPFVPRGSGTSLSGGSLPVETGIVIALNRLNHILRLDPEQRIAVVQPGVINLEVSRAAAPYGLYFAPDPSSQAVCTIGGNLAFNSGGAHCLKYGMTSNHILAVKAVLPTGEVVELGSESQESAGPDLVGLYVGSEGTFGVALEITLRLVPKPEVYRTILAGYRSMEAAGEVVAQVVASGLLPAAIELMDALAIEAAEAAHANYPADAAAVLIIELDGDVQQVEEQFKSLQSLIQASPAIEVRIAADDADRARIWKGRKSAFSAVGRLAPDYIVNDGVVPRTRLSAALAEIDQKSKQAGIRVANVFHAGDGNLHPLQAEWLAGEILGMCIRLGGSITGEHGVGVEKKAYLPKMFTGQDMATMNRLRRAVDPQEISNRGKML